MSYNDLPLYLARKSFINERFNWKTPSINGVFIAMVSLPEGLWVIYVLNFALLQRHHVYSTFRLNFGGLVPDTRKLDGMFNSRTLFSIISINIFYVMELDPFFAPDIWNLSKIRIVFFL